MGRFWMMLTHDHGQLWKAADPARSLGANVRWAPTRARYGNGVSVECKRTDAPTLTRSMQIALQDLKLDALYAVYPGNRRYWPADRIDAVPLAEFAIAQ